MVVPSNDLFIGNDNPTGIRLFDDDGNLVITEILQNGAAVWDAGTEIADPLAGAFVVGGTNALRVNENSPVTFELSELNAFDGVETPAGYFFDPSLVGLDTGIYRIDIAVVPEPASLSLLAAGAGALALRRRRA